MNQKITRSSITGPPTLGGSVAHSPSSTNSIQVLASFIWVLILKGSAGVLE